MDLLLGRLIGVSHNTKCLITTLLNLVTWAIDPSPYKLYKNLDEIWNLPLAEGNPRATEDLIYVTKLLLSTIACVRCYTAHIYCILLIFTLYPILTRRQPLILIPWMVLEIIRKILIDALAILSGVLMCWIVKCSFKNLLEFLILQSISWIRSVYNWLSVWKLYRRLTIHLKIIELARAQKNQDNDYEESLLSLNESPNVHSVLDINELRSPLHFLENQKLTKSLTTLLTTDSQNSEDIDKSSSNTSPDINLSPAQKSMKILGITDEDIMNVKSNINRKVSSVSLETVSAGNQITVKEVQCLCTTETCSDEKEKHSEKSDKLKEEEKIIPCDKVNSRIDPARQEFFDYDEFPGKWSSEEDLDDQKILENYMETYVNMIEQENCSTFYPADEKLSEQTILQKQSSFEEDKEVVSNNEITEDSTEPLPVISVALNDNQNNSTNCTNLKTIIRQLSNENWAMKIGFKKQLSLRFNQQCLLLSKAFSEKTIKSWFEHPVKCKIENFNELSENESNSVLKYSKQCNYSQTSWKSESKSKYVEQESSNEKRDMNANVMVPKSKKQNHQSSAVSIKIPKVKDHQEAIDESIHWGTVTLAQTARPSGYERIKSKPPVYPKQDKMSFRNNNAEPTQNPINRDLAKMQDGNRIRKRSKDRDSIRSSRSLRINRISESVEEREAREMKALRAYNEKTLVKDKLEMENKKRDKFLKGIGMVPPRDENDLSKFPMRNVSKNSDPLENVQHPKTHDRFVKKLNISGKDASSILEFLDTHNITQLREELKKNKDCDILEEVECHVLETEKMRDSLCCDNLSKDLQRKDFERTITKENIKNLETPFFQEVKCQETTSISAINERTSQDVLNCHDNRNCRKLTKESASLKDVIKNISWASFTKSQIESTTRPMENCQDNHWQDRNENQDVKYDDTLHSLMKVMHFTNQDETSVLKSLDYNRKFVNLELMIKDLKEWNFVGVPNEFVSQPSVEIDLSLVDSAIPCGFEISELNSSDEEPCTSAGISHENSSEIHSHTQSSTEDTCFNFFTDHIDFNDTKKNSGSIYVPQHFFLFESFTKNVTLPMNNFENIPNSENAVSPSEISSSHSYSLDSKVPSNSPSQTISFGDQSIMEEFSSESFGGQGTTDA